MSRDSRYRKKLSLEKYSVIMKTHCAMMLGCNYSKIQQNCFDSLLNKEIEDSFVMSTSLIS